jgi:2-methylcitrate dehydratase
MDRVIDQFSSYAESLSFEDLTQSSIRASKHRVIDSLGCMLGAYLEEPCKIARRICTPTDCPVSSRIIGSLVRTTPESAAFANGFMGRYLDFNDSIRIVGVGHPSDCIPAILSIGEACNARGKDLITAITLSYEATIQFIEVFAYDQKGWDQPTFLTLGIALGAGKILGLNKEQFANAVGLATVSNITLQQTRAGEISMWKAGAAGNAGRQGIFAALLAREGMTGPQEAFEGKFGYFNQVTGPLKLELKGGKGNLFAVERPNMKIFPVRDSCQLVILTALELRKKVSPDKIKSLHVKIYGSAYRTAVALSPNLWAPKTRETADHSIPFSIVVALLDGDVTPETFRKKRYLDPDVVNLLGQMTCDEDPGFSKQTPAIRNCYIEATTHSGEKVVAHSIFKQEELEKGWTDEEVEAKYMKLAQTILTPNQARTCLNLLWKLEEVDDTAQIIDNLQA